MRTNCRRSVPLESWQLRAAVRPHCTMNDWEFSWEQESAQFQSCAKTLSNNLCNDYLTKGA